MTRLVFAGIAALSVATGCRQAEAQPPAPASAAAVSTTNDVQTRIGVMNFERGYPTAETARKLFDELDYQRAVQAYLWGYPAVSFESIRIATKRDLNGELNEMFIADKFADAQSVFLTANDTTIYAYTNVDLGKAGPIVIDVPARANRRPDRRFLAARNRRRRAARSLWRQGRQVPVAATRLQG